jgi:ATP-dependent DNA ligase
VASFADNRFDRCDLLQRNVIHHGKSFPRGMRFSEHLDGDGETIFKHACKMGLEGIVSKRRDFPYRSGRCKSWVKLKNPGSAAVLRIQDGSW